MSWGDPGRLWLLWLIPAAAVWIALDLRRRKRRRALLLSQALWPVLAPAFDARRERRAAGIWFLGFAALVLALPRPQWGYRWEDIQRKGLDMVILLDTSRSMLATDVRPHRLQAARWGLLDLVAHLEGDRVALQVFEGGSYLLCPLTSDYGAFRMTLEDVYAGMVPRGGTAIEQALREAVDVFDEDRGADRVILLISDGEDHEGDPLRVVPLLRARGIRLLVVGIGTPEGDLIPRPGEPGAFLRDAQGRIVTTRLDEARLVALAQQAGGLYIRATASDIGTRRLLDEGLAGLQRTAEDTERQQVPAERFPVFLGVSFCFLAAEALTRLRQGRAAAGQRRER